MAAAAESSEAAFLRFLQRCGSGSAWDPKPGAKTFTDSNGGRGEQESGVGERGGWHGLSCVGGRPQLRHLERFCADESRCHGRGGNGPLLAGDGLSEASAALALDLAGERWKFSGISVGDSWEIVDGDEELGW